MVPHYYFICFPLYIYTYNMFLSSIDFGMILVWWFESGMIGWLRLMSIYSHLWLADILFVHVACIRVKFCIKKWCIAYPPHTVGFDTMVPFRWNVEDSPGFKCNLLHSVTLTMHISHSQLSLLETKHVESGAQLSKITFMFIFLCRYVATRVQQEHLSLTMQLYNKICC